MKRSFPPLINENSRILILGSLPGAESLRLQQYYAYKYNHFWKIIFEIFNGGEELTDYGAKRGLLLGAGLALWDVAESAERDGSLDSQIKKLKPNDIPALLGRFTNVRFLIFNGGFAFSSYKKSFGEPALPYAKVLSTSPACARRFEEKLEQWRNAIKRGFETA